MVYLTFFQSFTTKKLQNDRFFGTIDKVHFDAVKQLIKSIVQDEVGYKKWTKDKKC